VDFDNLDLYDNNTKNKKAKENQDNEVDKEEDNSREK
jgi:hypothetical protein